MDLISSGYALGLLVGMVSGSIFGCLMTLAAQRKAARRRQIAAKEAVSVA